MEARLACQCEIWRKVADEIGMLTGMPTKGKLGGTLDARREGGRWVLEIPDLPRHALSLGLLVIELGRVIGERMGDRSAADVWERRIGPLFDHLAREGYAPYL